MPEEPLETHELREQMEEAKEHAEHGHGKQAPWAMQLSLSTALIAVFAAVTSLQSGATEGHALLEKNEAIQSQARATDQWAYFQAKSTKAAIYESNQLLTDNPETLAKLKERVTKYEREKGEIEVKAHELERESSEHDKKGEVYLHRHHRFALGVTIFQVAIALSAIAALTKKKPLWYGSLLVSAVGVVFFLKGFALLGG